MLNLRTSGVVILIFVFCSGVNLAAIKDKSDHVQILNSNSAIDTSLEVEGVIGFLVVLGAAIFLFWMMADTELTKAEKLFWTQTFDFIDRSGVTRNLLRDYLNEVSRNAEAFKSDISELAKDSEEIARTVKMSINDGERGALLKTAVSTTERVVNVEKLHALDWSNITELNISKQTDRSLGKIMALQKTERMVKAGLGRFRGTNRESAIDDIREIKISLDKLIELKKEAQEDLAQWQNLASGIKNL